MGKRYNFIGFFFVLLIPITLLGFSKTYLAEFPHFEKNPGVFIHFHFVVSALWILLFIIQPFLIRAKKHQWHKRLGKISYGLFFLILVSFVPLYLSQIKGGYLPLIMLTTFDIVLLILFYVLGIKSKGNPLIHMRYMIALVLVFTLPALGRINSHWLGFSFIENMHIGFCFSTLLLLGLIFYDRRNKLHYKPYTISLAGFSVRQLAIYLTFYQIV